MKRKQKQRLRGILSVCGAVLVLGGVFVLTDGSHQRGFLLDGERQAAGASVSREDLSGTEGTEMLTYGTEFEEVGIEEVTLPTIDRSDIDFVPAATAETEEFCRSLRSASSCP